jgi:hypothetical protein
MGGKSMRIQNVIILALVLMGWILFTGCTGNPFWDSDMDNDGHSTITGSVQLQGDDDLENVYVWLEGLNVSASTDANGNYTLELPEPPSQPGGGLTGSLKLYYYLGNYEYKTATVYLNKGYLEHGQGDLGDDGSITKRITLIKLLEIRTMVIPQMVQQFDSVAYLQIVLHLKNLASSVRIETIQGPSGSLIGYMFKKKDGPVHEAILNPSDRSPVESLIVRETEIIGGARAFDLDLIAEPAAFDVIPYIYVIQDNLPPELIAGIDENAGEYHSDYINIPFKQNLGSFTCFSSSKKMNDRDGL